MEYQRSAPIGDPVANASFGYWVRRRRQALDLTQAVLARQVGCATITIQKIERDERRPSRQMAVRLAECLLIPEQVRPRFFAIALGEMAVDPLGLDLHPADLRAAQPNHARLRLAKVQPKHSNLPQQLTSFVGRESELAALDELVSHQDAHLITITGPGGMGKTRLALALAQRYIQVGRFVHGVFFISLASLSNLQHIEVLLAETLSFSLQPSAESGTHRQQLLEYMRTKSMLLIFDNYEHLLDGTELLTQILLVAPQVRLLVTSRERLYLPGEYLFPIQGLATEPTDPSTVETSSDAAQLFVQSARLIVPNLRLDEKELGEVDRICRHVGGMPLGIELAASWIMVMSPADIRVEIQRSIDILESEARGGREEHRSMRAVFDSTWNWLEATEQNVFARLALFRGGFTRAAAAEVAGASLRLLSALVSKSLIVFDHEQDRYTIHELLRQFAEEKLLTVPESSYETYKQFCDYYAAFLQQQEARIKGREHTAAVSAIEAEIENVRMAWRWSIAQRYFLPFDSGLEALYLFYVFKSWYEEALSLFKSAADAMQVDESEGQQGILLSRMLTTQGAMLWNISHCIGDTDAAKSAKALFEKSLNILSNLGTREQTGLPLYGLGVICLQFGKIEQAIEFGRRALTVFEEEGNSFYTSFVLRMLGRCGSYTGNYQEAIHYYCRSIAACEKIGDTRSLGDSFCALGDALKATGKFEEAKHAAENSLAANREVGSMHQIASSLRLLAQLAWYTGDLATAEQHAEASQAIFQKIGLTHSLQAPLIILGNIAYSSGDHTKARAYFYRVLRANLNAGTLNANGVVADALTGLAAIAVKEGDMDRSVDLLGLAFYHPFAWQESKDRAARLWTEFSQEKPDQLKPSIRPLNVVITELLNDEWFTV